MELRVNDYVRTKNGFISEIININDFREPSMKYALEKPSWGDDIVFIGDEKIKKSSPNIIDLIEVGDYVNGRLVEWKSEDFVAFGRLDYAYEEDIKSIVTKEQFEVIKYEIK